MAEMESKRAHLRQLLQTLTEKYRAKIEVMTGFLKPKEGDITSRVAIICAPVVVQISKEIAVVVNDDSMEIFDKVALAVSEKEGIVEALLQVLSKMDQHLDYIAEELNNMPLNFLVGLGHRLKSCFKKILETETRCRHIIDEAEPTVMPFAGSALLEDESTNSNYQEAKDQRRKSTMHFGLQSEDKEEKEVQETSKIVKSPKKEKKHKTRPRSRSKGKKHKTKKPSHLDSIHASKKPKRVKGHVKERSKSDGDGELERLEKANTWSRKKGSVTITTKRKNSVRSQSLDTTVLKIKTTDEMNSPQIRVKAAVPTNKISELPEELKMHLLKSNEKITLYIKVIEGRKLSKKLPNPFVRIFIDGEKVFRTMAIKSKNGGALWVQEFYTDLDPKASEITFRVCSQSSFGKGRSPAMCEKTILVPILRAARKIQGWFDLERKGGGVNTIEEDDNTTVGSIRIKLEYIVTCILPDTYYDGFFDVCSSSPFVANLLDQLSGDVWERKSVLRCLIAALHHKKKAIPFINMLLKIEIDNTRESAVLFRSSTLVTHCVEGYLNLLANELLQKVLKHHIEELYKDETSLELNPMHLNGDEGKTERHAKRLGERVEAIWKDIADNFHLVPEPIQRIFEYIRLKVSERWPDEPLAKYTGVTSFIFLRFFNSALTTPYSRLYGLAEQKPSDNTTRNLTLISKVMMSIANFRKFGRKEDFLMVMNPVVEKINDAMTSYIDQISDPTNISTLSPERLSLIWEKYKTGETQKVTVRGETMEYPEAMAQVVGVIMKHLDKINEMPVTPELTELLEVVKPLQIVDKRSSKLDTKRVSGPSTPLTPLRSPTVAPGTPWYG